MTSNYNFLDPLFESGRIWTSARAIILNRSRDRLLVEKNRTLPLQFLNFIGGGVELGETLETALRREMSEETNALIIRLEYLFVLENIFHYKGAHAHGLEHYFQVKLDRQDVQPIEKPDDFLWFPTSEISQLDLRPHIVHDIITDGSYSTVRHLVSREEIG